MPPLSRAWCFTAHNPPNDDLQLDETVRYAVWQREVTTNGTPHLQGYIEFEGPKRRTGVLKFLPHGTFTEPRAGTRDDARDYCRKEDTRQAGPWEYGTWEVGGRGARNDIREAVNTLRTFGFRRVAEEHPEILVRYPRGMREIATHLQVRDVGEPVTAVLQHWQQELVDRFNGPPDDRDIIWVIDVVGGKGKSFLAEYLVANMDGIKLRGKDADILHAYNGQRVAIFDMPRRARTTVPYEAMEDIKNGVYFTGKYESGMRRFKRPHVVVFANFEPDPNSITQDKLVIVRL